MTASSRRILRPTAANLRRAAAALRAGGLVAFPTETVYGLGADATSDDAVAAIFAAKRRPRFNPLIVHFASARDAARVVVFDQRARRLAKAFWPGPLTMVLPRRPNAPISWLASAGLDTLGVRVPDHLVARALIAVSKRPLAAPSANPAGRISPTTARHVAAGLGRRLHVILDAGPARIGVESTVIDLSTPRPTLLRPGGVPVEAIERVIGRVSRKADDRRGPKSPGRLASHYAPRRPVRLGAKRCRPGEALLGFGRVAPSARPTARGAFRNLSEAGDLAEAAVNLFAFLRALDRPGFSAIAVMPIPEHGLGAAINDRLRRAAAPRPPDRGGK